MIPSASSTARLFGVFFGLYLLINIPIEVLLVALGVSAPAKLSKCALCLPVSLLGTWHLLSPSSPGLPR